VRFHKARIYFDSLFERLYSAIEVTGLLTRHSDDDIGFVILGVDRQCSFGGKDGIPVMTLVEMKQTDVEPTTSEVRF